MKPDFERIPLPDKDAVDSDQTVKWEAYVQHLVKGQEVSPAGDLSLEQMLNDLSFFEFQGDALKLLPSKKEKVTKPKQRPQVNAFKSIQFDEGAVHSDCGESNLLNPVASTKKQPNCRTSDESPRATLPLTDTLPFTLDEVIPS